MSEPQLRIAIIGTGNISQAHFDGYRAAGATVVALCDVDPIQLAARARSWGVERTYTEIDEGVRDAMIMPAYPSQFPMEAVQRLADLALEHGLDHLVEAEPALDVQLRREPHLGVDDTVVGQVLGALGGHADEGVALLHQLRHPAERSGRPSEKPVVSSGGASSHLPSPSRLSVGRLPSVAAMRYNLRYAGHNRSKSRAAMRCAHEG